MALGPMVLMAGVTIKANYFLTAGALIASNGWLDVILWSCTMVFLAPKEIRKAGLADFQFLRTNSTKYGNMVWVEGGRDDGSEQRRGRSILSIPNIKIGRFERKWPQQEVNRNSGRQGSHIAILDAEGGIQIETSTTVLVENRRDSKTSGQSRPHRRMSDIVSVPARVAHLF